MTISRDPISPRELWAIGKEVWGAANGAAMLSRLNP